MLFSMRPFHHPMDNLCPAMRRYAKNKAPQQKLRGSDCRQSRFLSLRTSDRCHWCGNPHSLKALIFLSFIRERIPTPVLRHWLGMTATGVCLQLEAPPRGRFLLRIWLRLRRGMGGSAPFLRRREPVRRRLPRGRGGRGPGPEEPAPEAEGPLLWEEQDSCAKKKEMALHMVSHSCKMM